MPFFRFCHEVAHLIAWWLPNWERAVYLAFCHFCSWFEFVAVYFSAFGINVIDWIWDLLFAFPEQFLIIVLGYHFGKKSMRLIKLCCKYFETWVAVKVNFRHWNCHIWRRVSTLLTVKGFIASVFIAPPWTHSRSLWSYMVEERRVSGGISNPCHSCCKCRFYPCAVQALKNIQSKQWFVEILNQCHIKIGHGEKVESQGLWQTSRPKGSDSSPKSQHAQKVKSGLFRDQGR